MPPVEITQRTNVDISNASGLVVLAPDDILVVDDNEGVFRIHGGKANLVCSKSDHEELRDLEGICWDRARERLLLISEKTARVLAVPLELRDANVVLGTPREVGRLPRIGRTDNKGWEGIAWARADVLADVDVLVAVHEGKPKRVGLFALPSFDTIAIIALPKAVKRQLDDLSDVEVVPEAGTILLLSDESRAIVEVRVVQEGGDWKLDPVECCEVDVGRGEKPEGLCRGPDNGLWMVTDGDAHVYRLAWPTRPVAAVVQVR